MREPLKDPGRLQHMLDMALLLKQESIKHTLDDLRSDAVSFYGVSKMIEIIGEAAYMITKEYKEDHPQIPWRQIEGMRHILMHGYYTVSPEVIWETLVNDIPSLIPYLKEYISESQKV